MSGMCCLGKELGLSTLCSLSPTQAFWSPKQREWKPGPNTIQNSLKGKCVVDISSEINQALISGGISGIFIQKDTFSINSVALLI